MDGCNIFVMLLKNTVVFQSFIKLDVTSLPLAYLLRQVTIFFFWIESSEG